MAENVKVAVRVRPFNDREKARKAALIIGMNGSTTTIKEPGSKEKPREFAFDFSYWSHDDFKEGAGGYLDPKSAKYADQKRVFEDLGKGVLANAWKGYNTSLFAYGQTGSGKSYSMVGYGANKGIVPVASEELFTGIEEKRKTASKDDEYQVTLSMLEIYNEQVRDLLNPKSLKVKGGLKVRENPKLGFYVETLTSAAVNSYKEIDAKQIEGTKNRTVASTNMNATSSRAHTIVAIKFTQKSNSSGQSMTKSSVMNLVDLAGSERADSTGATGDRLKEGSAINQSLSSLGNVIKALADASSGKKGVMVPFRDSVLTKLLKNALGGNSKTIMIAALSPADINYEETLSTLRFADRAKAIKTKATVNESPTDKLIRELKEENQRLMDMLKTGGVAPVKGGGGGGGGGGEQDDEARAAMEEELRKNQEEMSEMQRTWEERMKEKEKEIAAALAAEKTDKSKRESDPHFWNLNEDPALTGVIVHFVSKGKSKVGNNKADKEPEMMLSGLGIQPDHAVIDNSKDTKIMLIPSKGAKIVLNGNPISDKKELHHNDRVMFGSSMLFVFHHPKDMATQVKKKKEVPRPNFETAQEEIAKNSGLSKLTGDGKSKEDLLLQEDLVQLWPMMSEANAMSEEMDKKDKFEIALIAPQARGKKDGRTEVCIKMKNMENNCEFLWDRNKFINRKYLMQEMYQNFVDGDADWNLPCEKDPFWEDPTSEVHIGSVHVYLQSLAYQIDIEETLNITDYKGIERGVLKVKLVPCKANGGDIGDDYVDDPAELIGKDLHFKLQIDCARGLPKNYAKTFCKYRFYLDQDACCSKELGGINPDYGFSKQIDFNTVTQQLVDYLEGDSLIIDIYGRQQEDTSQSSLTTKEMMMKDPSIGGGGAKGDRPGSALHAHDHAYKMAAEANTFKKRMERAEAKLKAIQELVDKTKKAKKDSVQIADIERVLRGGRRLKAVARMVHMVKTIEKTKEENLGTKASRACVIQ